MIEPDTNQPKGSTMKKATTHTTHVAHLARMGLWQPYCDQCGDIGLAERYEQDAYGIADRHQQISGFES